MNEPGNDREKQAVRKAAKRALKALFGMAEKARKTRRKRVLKSAFQTALKQAKNGPKTG